jgi:hypothetical protein
MSVGVMKDKQLKLRDLHEVGSPSSLRQMYLTPK